MKLEKVYDELYGMIEDLKKQIAAATGSDVTITPTLESGTKVADYTIGEEEGSLYAPDPYIHEYSTTPHKVGEWIDGSDIYEVTKQADSEHLYTLKNTQWTDVSGLFDVDIESLVDVQLNGNQDGFIRGSVTSHALQLACAEATYQFTTSTTITIQYVPYVAPTESKNRRKK